MMTFIRNLPRRNDFVARLGSDEFGVLMTYCSLNEAFRASENLRDLISVLPVRAVYRIY